MKERLYECNRCKDEGTEFTVPADEFGVEFMKAHLWEKHKYHVVHHVEKGKDDF